MPWQPRRIDTAPVHRHPDDPLPCLSRLSQQQLPIQACCLPRVRRMTSDSISRSPVRSVAIFLSRLFSLQRYAWTNGTSALSQRISSASSLPHTKFVGWTVHGTVHRSPLIRPKEVTWVIQAFQRTSATGVPSLPCVRTNAFRSLCLALPHRDIGVSLVHKPQ